MMDDGFWMGKANKPQMYKCWMIDDGCWIEKDKKTQRDDGGFFTLIKKRLSFSNIIVRAYLISFSASWRIRMAEKKNVGHQGFPAGPPVGRERAGNPA